MSHSAPFIHPSLEAITRRLKRQEHTRLVAFTNADHYYAGMFWTEVVDFCLRTTFGRQHHVINASDCGDQAERMLKRLETDVLFYQPHLVMLLLGGAEPLEQTAAAFDQNLRAIVQQITQSSTSPSSLLLLTYYGLDRPQVDPDRLALIDRNMDLVRALADETGCALHDPLRRWEHLRLHHPESFASLLQDPLHINARGNLLYGLDIARLLGADLELVRCEAWSDAFRILGELDDCNAAASTLQ